MKLAIPLVIIPISLHANAKRVTVTGCANLTVGACYVLNVAEDEIVGGILLGYEIRLVRDQPPLLPHSHKGGPFSFQNDTVKHENIRGWTREAEHAASANLRIYG
jgi:hypothetical protein